MIAKQVGKGSNTFRPILWYSQLNGIQGLQLFKIHHSKWNMQKLTQNIDMANNTMHYVGITIALYPILIIAQYVFGKFMFNPK